MPFTVHLASLGAEIAKKKHLDMTLLSWANIGRDVKRHTLQGSMHHKNVQSEEGFIRIREGEKSDICISMSKS